MYFKIIFYDILFMVIKMNNIFCIDIGGSKLICGALTETGEILDTVRAEYPKNYTIETIINLIFEGYQKLRNHNFCACGIAVPGLCDYEHGTWLYSPFSGIADIPIVQIIKDKTNLPTFADNDVNISAMAERYFGVCKNIDNFLWITVSNGIGGGLYLDGNIYRGKNLSAGEIGHFVVEENGRKCGCGNIGCLEAHASGASIAAIYNEKTNKNLSAKDIADLARNGDKIALETWQNAGRYIGKAASYAVNLLNIDTVVLGGGAAEAFDLLEPTATELLNINLFKKANPQAKILHSSPGKYAALKGCAAIVLENQKERL